MGYAENYASNHAAILRDLGRSQAEAKLRKGAAWGQAISDIGQTVAGIPGQLQDEKRRKQQDQIIDENLRQLMEQRQEHQWLNDALNSSVVDGKIDERRLTENLNLMGATQLVPQAVQTIRESEEALQRLKNAQQQGEMNAQTLRKMAIDYFTPFAKAIQESDFDPSVVNGALKVVELQAGPQEAAQLRQQFSADPSVLKLMVQSVLVPEKEDEYTLNPGDVRFKGKTQIAANPKEEEAPKTLEQLLTQAFQSTDPDRVERINEIVRTMKKEADAKRGPVSGPAPQYQWAKGPDGTVRLMSADEIRRSGASQADTADMRNKGAAKEIVSAGINAIKTLGEKVITRVGPAQRAEALTRGAAAVFGSDPEFRTYQDARFALAGNLAVAQQGSRPSDADIEKGWLPLVPDVYSDTSESAKMKWELINTLLLGKQGSSAESQFDPTKTAVVDLTWDPVKKQFVRKGGM